jgi:hypothetical protein
MRLSFLPLSLALLSPALGSAQTGPFLSEEATTAPAGRLRLEASAAFISGEPNFLTGLERDRWDVPVLRLVYSPADAVEIDLEWVGCVIALDDPTFGTAASFGDVTLRTKLRLLEETAGRAGLAARFEVTLPETSAEKGLGPNALRVSAQMLSTRTLGRVRVDLNAGIAIHDAPTQAGAQADFFDYGVAVRRRFGARVEAGVEVAGRVGKPETGAEETSEARLGVRYGAGRTTWHAALRKGLTYMDGDWGFTLGLTWTPREGGARDDEPPDAAPTQAPAPGRDYRGTSR